MYNLPIDIYNFFIRNCRGFNKFTKEVLQKKLSAQIEVTPHKDHYEEVIIHKIGTFRIVTIGRNIVQLYWTDKSYTFNMQLNIKLQEKYNKYGLNSYGNALLKERIA